MSTIHPFSPTPLDHVSCSIKALPTQQIVAAAAHAVAINPRNAPSRQLVAMGTAQGVVLPAAFLAVLTQKRWPMGGVRLTVGFMEPTPADLRARIVSHMNAWGTYGNVQFTESSDSPQVRIAFTPGDGYWSYLGTDVAQIDADQATMNLDSFTMKTPESEFRRVVRHETGHTLGFPHEHMRAAIIANIDIDKATAYFLQTQGWSAEMTKAQVLTPLESSALLGTLQADPESIMCYWLPADIMKNRIAVTGGTDIDPQDQQFTGIVYPLVH